MSCIYTSKLSITENQSYFLLRFITTIQQLFLTVAVYMVITRVKKKKGKKKKRKTWHLTKWKDEPENSLVEMLFSNDLARTLKTRNNYEKKKQNDSIPCGPLGGGPPWLGPHCCWGDWPGPENRPSDWGPGGPWSPRGSLGPPGGPYLCSGGGGPLGSLGWSLGSIDGPRLSSVNRQGLKSE